MAVYTSHAVPVAGFLSTAST